MITHIAFDFDGTLLQSNSIKRNAYFGAASLIQCPTSVVEAILKTNHGDRRAVLDEIVQWRKRNGALPSELGPAAWTERLVDTYSRICRAEIIACAEVYGATDTLRKLNAQDYRLFVNSSTPLKHLEDVIEARGMADLFASLYGRPSDKISNLRTIIASEKIDPTNLLCVGDGSDDRSSAVAVGCSFVGVVAGDAPGPRPFRSPPTRQISDLRHLPNEIAKVNADIAIRDRV